MDLSLMMRQFIEEFAELEARLADPEVLADPSALREVSQRRAALLPRIELYREYEQALSDGEEARAMLAEVEDEESDEFLRGELTQATETADALRDRLLLMLLPADPMESRGAIIEIRAGTGGEEAALFAGDLFQMYSSFADRRGWPTSVIAESPSEIGGYKEIIFQVDAPGAYGVLRLESGVHRVQRVPVTESQGRIHTSAATVVVLPVVEDVDVDLNAADLRFEAFRAGGPGGQHMQKNETAVRVTHIPTRVSVTCSDARSQHQNREKALRLLRARIYEVRLQEQEEALARQRREQVRSGDRSEKIRTYNFPQDRITDHRAGVTVHDLQSRLVGEIDELLEAVSQWERQTRLQEFMESSQE